MDDRRAELVALIEHMDDGIGRIIHTLDETNEAKNTMVLFVSENGGQLNVGGRCGPHRGGKQDMYEGGIRVPAGVRWPGHAEPGSESARVTLTMDLLPTLCEVAGADVNHKIDGVSFLPTLKGASQEEPTRTLFLFVAKAITVTRVKITTPFAKAIGNWSTTIRTHRLNCTI